MSRRAAPLRLNKKIKAPPPPPKKATVHELAVHVFASHEQVPTHCYECRERLPQPRLLRDVAHLCHDCGKEMQALREQRAPTYVAPDVPPVIKRVTKPRVPVVRGLKARLQRMADMKEPQGE